MSQIEPFLLGAGGKMKRAIRIPRDHKKFNEQYLQELLASYPELLPVEAFRPDIGELVCIGREVPTPTSGTIDNLYLSSSGYVVIIETKLWRNPQSRREVLSQILDYVKDIVSCDFEWLESVWKKFSRERGIKEQSLFEVMSEASIDELDEALYIEQVQKALTNGDIIALIVGDGISTKLQELVSHLCRDTAHLRYSLGLVSLNCYEVPDREDSLIIPELVQEVEPVQRAYVRIELDEALKEQAKISSVVERDDAGKPGKKRITLTEDAFFESLEESMGRKNTERVWQFLEELRKIGIEPEFKSRAVMLKVPDPEGEYPSACLLAIEKMGRVYNQTHGWSQVLRWGLDEDKTDWIIGDYWRKLHTIDRRFSVKGISHVEKSKHLPFEEVIDKLDEIRDAMQEVVTRIRQVYEGKA